MSQKSITLIIVLFVLLVLGMFIFAHLKSSELEEVDMQPVQQEEVSADKYSDINRIDAKHYYIDGMHTLVGEINFPTPCDLLETDSLVMESMPEQVRLNFTVINNSEDCQQVPTAQRFKIEATASSLAEFSGWFMGREVELNLIPAREGELPAEFELFIKG